MTTKELLKHISASAFGNGYQEEICNIYHHNVIAGRYAEEENEYQEAITFLRATLAANDLALLSEYENTCTHIREFSAIYGFQAGLLCGFLQFFTNDNAKDGGFEKYVSNQIGRMPNMLTYPGYSANITNRNSLYSKICDTNTELVHTHMISLGCAWSQRAYSASIDGFHCGYHGAMAIIDKVMPLPYGSTTNVNKTLSMEYFLGYINLHSKAMH